MASERSLEGKLDVIERFGAPGCQPRIGEVLHEQEVLYKTLGVPSPISS